MKKSVGLGLFVGLLVACIVGWRFYGGELSPPKSIRHEAFPPLPTWTIHTSSFSQEFEAPATLQAQESTQITASVTELIKKISFQEGQWVEKDTILVELSHGEESGNLAQALALQKEKQSALDRTQALFEKGATPRARYDEALHALQEAQGQVEAIKDKLKDRLITAPFSGMIGVRRVSEGALVTPGTVMTTLDDLSSMTVQFFLPERALPSLYKGQKVTVFVEAFPAQSFEATLQLVDTRVEAATRTVEVQATLENPQGLLRNGMSAQVRLTGAPIQGILIPESALLSFASQQFVFVLDSKNQVHKRPVEATLHKAGWALVGKGLQEGEVLIQEGVAFLQDQQKIIPQKGAGTP